MRDLVETLQRLYDSEINVTITWLWDGGFDIALISYMEWAESGTPIDYWKPEVSVEPRERPNRPDPWHSVNAASKLADAIHDAALGKYPESDYTKKYGQS